MQAVVIVAVISLIVSVIISTGAVAFIFKYGIRLALAEQTLNSLERVGTQLDKLPSIEAKMEQLVELFKTYVAQQITRPEFDSRIVEVERRVAALETAP